MTSNPVSLGPSRDAAAVMVLTAGVVGLLAAGWQFFQGLEARSVSLTIFAAGIAAISAMTLGRWLFQIVSRETITIGDGVLALNVAIGPWKRDRVFSLNDVARPRIELRRYRGKFGRSSLLNQLTAR